MSTSRRNFLKTAGLLGGATTVMGFALLPKSLSAATSRSRLPYYLPGAPFTNDLRSGNGEAFTLQGTVFGPDGKSPLREATVEIWHCDEHGQFDFSHQFIYRGKTLTDGHGRYRIKTHFPGRYQEGGQAKMSRVFVLVSSKSYQESFSQLYFDSRQKPFINSKDWAACPMAQRPSLPKQYRKPGDVFVVCDHFLQTDSLLPLASPNEVAARHLRIYPVAGNRLVLSFGKAQPGLLAVRLTDRKGKLVANLRFRNVTDKQELTIADQALPPGAYTCSIYSSRFGNFTRKLSIA